MGLEKSRKKLKFPLGKAETASNPVRKAKDFLTEGVPETELEKFNDEYVGKDLDAQRHPEEQMIPKGKFSQKNPSEFIEEKTSKK
jgi:hypothetical protein